MPGSRSASLGGHAAHATTGNLGVPTLPLPAPTQTAARTAVGAAPTAGGAATREPHRGRGRPRTSASAAAAPPPKNAPPPAAEDGVYEVERICAMRTEGV